MDLPGWKQESGNNKNRPFPTKEKRTRFRTGAPICNFLGDIGKGEGSR